ncbi:MAG: hypothetical protein ACNI27_07035 [Desulfovibrio sp.]
MEKRKRTATALLQIQSKKSCKIEIFDAEQWPAKGGKSGLFRVRIDGKWYSVKEQYCFFTPDAIGRLLIAGLIPTTNEEDFCLPDLPNGTAVSYPTGKMFCSKPVYTKSRTRGEPIRLFDGRWYVFVYDYESRDRKLVPVDDLKL